MSLASETRRAAEAHPFLISALRAGIVNYTAGARFLEVDGETDAVATALRRYAEDLPEYESRSGTARVTMESGIGPLEPTSESSGEAQELLTVGESAFGPGGDGFTAILVTGDIDPSRLATGLQALALEGIGIEGAGICDGTMIVVVERLEGANAVRAIERVL